MIKGYILIHNITILVTATIGNAHYADADDNRSFLKRLDMGKNLRHRYEDKNSRLGNST